MSAPARVESSAPVDQPATGAGTTAATVQYLLRLGDDALVLAQRLGAQLTRAPQLEEDVALANIALDLLGQARPLLARAGELEGRGRDEDALAFLREERDFLNCQLVEQPDVDFAGTIARQLLFSCYQLPLLQALTTSADEVLAGVAGKGVKEVAYHRDHAVQWTLRLGDGTEESSRRMQAALDRLWPFAAELFESDDLVRSLAVRGVAVDPASVRPRWDADVDAVLAEAGLARPSSVRVATGGRRGLHTECFGYLLAEMQHLARSHPGATW
ncbi:ring-1,2-phenylacetyl-CoA epoxidase subunit PaaC [Kineococcus xinjiangensis]|uniref:Ring-1,2-phenylacetyl-CoA epoxidase subunit PaaC n=1 Tax=Kineococcus xinjiangensis TaxID=512762 RepID=A0A2S6IK53_9ACTN|nr:1,2-phenylacetyl-CoA epoxidase subunit PaaC [Kineococcus xinjiangensis]PPK94589.1 ring-1,2-phenylacetyl-CoA epoxidase subunit PaaC [Kineococcus xinjiangensis]